jgi:hypothetical protein
VCFAAFLSPPAQAACFPQVIAHYGKKVVDIKADRAATEVEAAIAKALA